MFGIRWMHTSTTATVHNATGFFLRSFYDRIALLNSPNGWQHYSTILKAESLGLSTTEIDRNCYINHTNSKDKLQQIVEENLPTKFLPLKSAGVKIQPFNNQKLTSRAQAEPDAVFDFSNQKCFLAKGIHGLDQKSGKFGLTNVIFSDMQDKIYHDQLQRVQSAITFQYALSQEELLAITLVIAELKKTVVIYLLLLSYF